jgi:hypothetical protein
MRSAIETSFLGATNTKSARIVARQQDSRVVVPYDHNLSQSANHMAAAKALAERYCGPGELVGGETIKGYVFVFQEAAAGWVVFRPELLTPVIGPFPTEDAARAWQDRDNAKSGDAGDWSTWPMNPPALN